MSVTSVITSTTSISTSISPSSLTTGHNIRVASRTNAFNSPTPGLAPGYLQANLIVLPSTYADDFRTLCLRNPVPCPLLAETSSPGDYSNLRSNIPGITGEQIAKDLDLRRDAPRYMVYRDGKVDQDAKACEDVSKYWTDDHVGFLIGCSFSFETALMEKGLTVAHIKYGRNVPMYRTTRRLCNAGRFEDRTYVVSMRPYEAEQVEAVKAVTRMYGLTHGEPIAWGWDAVKELGIKDITQPEYGDAPINIDGTPFHKTSKMVPVFWGCGVTPQQAIMGHAIEGTVLGHMPGHMIVLDLKEEDVFGP